MDHLPVITWPYRLRKGHSDDPSQGACAMDAINWLVHGKHGDQPGCACPVIGAYVISGNDNMPDNTRQRLLAYLPRIAGSRSNEHEAARLRIMVLAAARVFAPLALDAAGFHKHAETLRSLPDDASYESIRTAAYAANAVANAAAHAAYAAAYAAARAAADAVAYVAHAADAASDVWDLYFAVLDEVLNAGPQGKPWSAYVVEQGTKLYRDAGGRMVLV